MVALGNGPREVQVARERSRAVALLHLEAHAGGPDDNIWKRRERMEVLQSRGPRTGPIDRRCTGDRAAASGLNAASAL